MNSPAVSRRPVDVQRLAAPPLQLMRARRAAGSGELRVD